MKEKLTDARLRKVPPAAPGKRVMLWDTEVGNFGVRVTDRVDPTTKEPSRTFIVMRRLNGELVRHKIGTYPAITLQQAREAAREANMDFNRGIDPRTKHALAEAAEASRRQSTFELAAEAFIKRHLSTIRSGSEVERSVRREMISRWGPRPVDEITSADIVTMLEEIIDAGHPSAARKMLAHSSKLFGWLVARRTFGISTSPVAGISAKEFFGKKTRRSRILDEAEIRALWRATDNLGFPLQPFVRLLLMLGQRRDELAKMTWQEVDLDKALWTIPAVRMKGDVAHEVPLSTQAVKMIALLPRFRGPFVFSTQEGVRPISGFSKFKRRIDEAMTDEMPAWVFHDLRRTMRTALSGLPVPHKVAELVIAHAQPELDRVYDLHRYRAEKSRALQLWADKLTTIVNPETATNVVRLAG